MRFSIEIGKKQQEIRNFIQSRDERVSCILETF